ncbi:MAG: xanthine dehydrogenase molybdopterin binding subunit [Oligoflexus sp.]
MQSLELELELEILPVTASEAHDSAISHVTGQSEFVDDRSMHKNEVLVGIVYSPHARAMIKSCKVQKALAIPGVLCVLTHQDVHHNVWGSIFPEQPFLAVNEVNFVGEVVAVVGAESREALQAGLKAVEVEYTALEPVLSITDAIAKQNFIGTERQISRGDWQNALQTAPYRLKGKLVIRGAEHFYLENQAAIVYPLEGGLFEVHSSTQHPTETQHLVAEALGIAHKDVVCIAKRLGGGFGGKETQAAPFAVYAALVAQAMRRPARLVLTKDDDMIVTGKRNPFEIHHEVGFDENGLILTADVQFFSDGGAYADLSTAIMERAMAHFDNAYFLPACRIRGQVCRTNIHPHTAFRGFGGPKGIAAIESILESIARHRGKDSLDIRRLNCYQGPDRDVTPYGQKLENNLLPKLFQTLEQRCRYLQRRQEIEAWNADPLNHPRGLAITAVKFGISFTTRFLNQGNALVNIHRDGTVQVSTGAVEMGQGVNARIASLVAEQFGLQPKQIRLMPTSTEKNANTSPTAASKGTDLNGSAAVLACERIKARLAALLLRLLELPQEQWAQNTAGLGTMPEIAVGDGLLDDQVIFANGQVYPKDQAERAIPFSTLIAEAYFNRISLSDYGYYRVPGLGFNKLTGQGQAFLYFTQGVACSEVELDPWTGAVKVLQTDILMDVGRPINNALDQGQIRGAFIQGMGWVTTEALHYDQAGMLLSHSPSTYKIPSVHDIPRKFTVELVKNEGNTKNLRGTKAVGEPPLMLCFSVWNAIKDAIGYREPWRSQKNLPDLPIPATGEQILRALQPELFAKWEGDSL